MHSKKTRHLKRFFAQNPRILKETTEVTFRYVRRSFWHEVQTILYTTLLTLSLLQFYVLPQNGWGRLGTAVTLAFGVLLAGEFYFYHGFLKRTLYSRTFNLPVTVVLQDFEYAYKVFTEFYGNDLSQSDEYLRGCLLQHVHLTLAAHQVLALSLLPQRRLEDLRVLHWATSMFVAVPNLKALAE